MAFVQSYSGELGDFEGFIQLIPGSYEDDKLNIIAGIDKVHSRCECINESIVKGFRGPILYSFDLTFPPGQKIYNQSKVKLFKKINKSVLSHITIYSEDDYPVDFNNENISFTCQLIKIY